MVGFQLKALDLAKIGYLLAREGAWDGQRIVSRKWQGVVDPMQAECPP